MNHGDFAIGGTFWCSGRQWRCTDVGTRVIVAIRIDSVQVTSTSPKGGRTLDRADVEVEGWFRGPPYAVAEIVFDEYDQAGCVTEQEAATL